MDLALLSKGLSFAPTPTTDYKDSQLRLLSDYDQFARTLRAMYVQAHYKTTLSGEKTSLEPTTTSFVHRKMKFMPKTNTVSSTQLFSGISQLEHYIELTKCNLNDQLPEILKKPTSNLKKEEKASIKSLKSARQTLTIKPADKNLGIVIINTDDYLQQCTKLLTNSTTYRLAETYPDEDMARKLTNTLVSFKSQLTGYSKKLYEYLQPKLNKTQIPKFYGIPKVHKKYDTLPPMRPIVAHTNSLLTPTARLLDHLLQPVAQTYPDYLHNSASISILLQTLEVPETAILVSVDVESLYPSIPQTECLNIIYEELHSKRHLLLFDPNLIIQLLHINVNHNYFEFATLIFQQITGTAMGAAFSPTIANIFMSVILRRFHRTQHHHPFLLKRYIDDIFIIWTKSQEQLTTYLTELNNFHPSLHYTHEYSTDSTNFLDLTIYKGPHFQHTKHLDTKTFQKVQNLYQYLHFTSCHQRSIHKAIIIGECIRYVRSNTTKENYVRMVQLFETRLHVRGYPPSFTRKTLALVSYDNRQTFLQQAKPQKALIKPPVFKCIAPPQFHHLKQVILENYSLIQKYVSHPRFVALRNRTLYQELVRAKINPTDEQITDLAISFGSPNSNHTTAGSLPQLRLRQICIKKCNHPRCSTCQHLQCQSIFTSTKTKKSYPIRHHFTCNSSKIIYLITCTKCKKQYVGMTTKQLNVRINHHRTSIFNKRRTYLHTHFNLPDHNISNLKVQAIDTIDTTEQNLDVHGELRKLEKFWIKTLKTFQPIGLNVTM